MKSANKRAFLSLFFLILISMLTFSVFISLVYADELTISTSQLSYNLGATVNISGKLTLGGNPVRDGLVAVQVEDRQGELKLIRTVNTGTNPSPWNVRVTKFTSCDLQGNSKNSFYCGSLAYFNVTFESLDTVQERRVIVALNMFDSVGVSIGITSISLTLKPKEQTFFFTSIPIPSDAYTGEATCTVSVLTNWPKTGGYPYCPEGVVKFKILDGLQGPSKPQQLSTSSNGNFNIYFKLPNNARIGEYSIYAKSRYAQAGPVYATFDYVWRSTDVDRNGEVNIKDIQIVAKAFDSKPGDPRWNPKADINGDNQVSIKDLQQVARDFGKVRRV